MTAAESVGGEQREGVGSWEAEGGSCYKWEMGGLYCVHYKVYLGHKWELVRDKVTNGSW